jgi:hypothetical protein
MRSRKGSKRLASSSGIWIVSCAIAVVGNGLVRFYLRGRSCNGSKIEK